MAGFPSGVQPLNCVIEAWDNYEGELRGFLVRELHDPALAEDLLQDVFLKALAQGSRFCSLDNTRAWLFRVARNRLIDHRRTHKDHAAIPDHLADEAEPVDAVASLARCLPRALQGLPPEDSQAIRLCDLEGMSQADYARARGLSLAGAKSRVQRARKRLKKHLKDVCQVRFDETGKVCCFVPRGRDSG